MNRRDFLKAALAATALGNAAFGHTTSAGDFLSFGATGKIGRGGKMKVLVLTTTVPLFCSSELITR